MPSSSTIRSPSLWPASTAWAPRCRPGRGCSIVSGQVGVDAKGKLQDGIEKQAAQVWKNIGQVLKSGRHDLRATSSR